jgi:hypothetical protein
VYRPHPHLPRRLPRHLPRRQHHPQHHPQLPTGSKSESGINYTGTRSALQGCINDALNIQGVLRSKYGFDVTLMTDNTARRPTQSNIITAIHELVRASQEQDVEEIFVSYSGHGSWIRDYNGDEVDGRDEVIVPLDYERTGFLSDDIINQAPKGARSDCRVVALFDSCHSGSVLDLQYRFNVPGRLIVENRSRNVTQDMVCISGCTDSTTSADAYIQSARRFQGAMTTAFLAVLAKHKYSVSCFDLLSGIQAYVRAQGHRQVPQLSTSRMIDDKRMFSAADFCKVDSR